MQSGQETTAPVNNTRRPARNRIRRVLGVVVAALAVLAVVGLVYQAVSVNADRQAHPPVGKMVRAGTDKLHLYCTGEGSPTVVLIAGAGNIYAHWDAVQSKLSANTRVCSYDRAGTGWSDYPNTQPTLESHVQDLHAVLQEAGESGPFIIVGHSLGGILARMYYNAYPQEVRGMVLVESSVEGMYQHLPSIIAESNKSGGAIWPICRLLAPFGIIRLAGLGIATANAFPKFSDTERAAIAATFYRTENCQGMAWETALTRVFESGAPTTLNDLPLVVLTRGLDDVQVNPAQKFSEAQAQTFQQVQKDWLVLQSQLVALSTNSRHVIADRSGHFIHHDQPELVIDAIRDVIAKSQP